MNYTSLVKYESTTSIATVWLQTCVLNDCTTTKMFNPKFHLQYYSRQHPPTMLSVAKKTTLCENVLPCVISIINANGILFADHTLSYRDCVSKPKTPKIQDIEH